MKIQITTGMLALVLIVGIIPAFAQEFTVPSEISPVELPPIDEEDEIFDNGRGNFTIGGPTLESSSQWADDFVLDEDTVLRDIHFDGIITIFEDIEIPVKEFEWFVYLDDEGLPGELLSSGNGTSEGQMVIEELNPSASLVRFWFDLDNPLALEGGKTYWLQIDTVDEDAEEGDSATIWLAKEPEFGNLLAVKDDDDPWEHGPPFDFNFVLTGDDNVVAGKFLPTDSTALFLAGLSQSAVWMVPTLAGIAGAGLIIRSKLRD